MNSSDQYKKDTRLDQLFISLAEIGKSNDIEQMIRHLGLMQLRCLDFIHWLDRVQDLQRQPTPRGQKNHNHRSTCDRTGQLFSRCGKNRVFFKGIDDGKG